MESNTNLIKKGGRMNLKQSVYWIIYILFITGLVIAMTVIG